MKKLNWKLQTEKCEELLGILHFSILIFHFSIRSRFFELACRSEDLPTNAIECGLPNGACPGTSPETDMKKSDGLKTEKWNSGFVAGKYFQLPGIYFTAYPCRRNMEKRHGVPYHTGILPIPAVSSLALREIQTEVRIFKLTG